MNSKTCDNCGTTSHDLRELEAWFQIVGRGNPLASLVPEARDACTQECGVAVMAKLASDRVGGGEALEAFVSGWGSSPVHSVIKRGNDGKWAREIAQP